MTQIEKNSVGIVQTKMFRVVEQDKTLELECGKTLSPVDVAYETYGKLNEAGDNAVLICHALSGDAHVAGLNSPDDKKSGWWDIMVGPGKGIDTNKYFVVCSNFLGGCSGTTGPGSINPATGTTQNIPGIFTSFLVKHKSLNKSFMFHSESALINTCQPTLLIFRIRKEQGYSNPCSANQNQPFQVTLILYIITLMAIVQPA